MWCVRLMAVACGAVVSRPAYAAQMRAEAEKALADAQREYGGSAEEGRITVRSLLCSVSLCLY